MERRSAKQIIDALAHDQKVKDACRQLGGNKWEDLYQELFVILCEKDPKQIEDIAEKDYLQFWIVRTLMNSTSATGEFYKKYHIYHVEGEKDIAEEDEDLQDFARKREVVEDILGEIEQGGRSKASWYKVNLLKLFAQTGNMSEMAKLTGIPFATIHYDITNIRREFSALIDKRV